MPQEPRPGKAKCLKCQKQFDSRDVCKNRICPSCTRTNQREYIPRITSTRVYSDGTAGSAVDHYD